MQNGTQNSEQAGGEPDVTSKDVPGKAAPSLAPWRDLRSTVLRSTGAIGHDRGVGYDARGTRLETTVPRLGPNEQILLNIVRDEGSISRTGLSKLSGISAATVGRVAAKLLAEEVLIEPRKLATPIGRPSVLLEVNASRASVIAITLAKAKISAAVADLAGTILWSATRDFDPRCDHYDEIIRSVNVAKAESHAAGIPVASVALGVPAIVDSESGRAIAGPHIEWDGFDLTGRLTQDLGIPFVVDNDTNLAALGHQWRGDATGSDNFCVFSIGTGIGGAILSNGQLLRGHRNAAAEFGYLAIDPSKVFSGKPTEAAGSLEHVVSESGITRRALEILATGQASTLTSSDDRNSDALTAQTVVEAALEGDAVAVEVIDAVLSQLSVAIANVVCIAGPEIVIIDGPVGKMLGPFAERLQDAVHRLAPGRDQIKMSTTAIQASLLGALTVGLELAWTADLPDKNDIVIGSPTR